MQQLRSKLHEVIFGTDTIAGRLFDIILLWLIVGSIIAVIFESVDSIRSLLPKLFFSVEWGFTLLFTAEYLVRIIASPKPYQYCTSFWGIIDLLSVVPTYISLFFGSSHALIAIRIIRLMRMFRILKLGKYISASDVIISALKASIHKITVFLFGVMIIVIIMGTLMYMVEGEQNGFENIPLGIYWAIVTLTTVGFGDLVPHTTIGKVLSSVMMIIGYAIIAVPTGIVTVELNRKSRGGVLRRCHSCQNDDNESDARFCKKCGEKLRAS